MSNILHRKNSGDVKSFTPTSRTKMHHSHKERGVFPSKAKILGERFLLLTNDSLKNLIENTYLGAKNGILSFNRNQCANFIT